MSLEIIMEELGQTLVELAAGAAAVAILAQILQFATGR
jgi:hypothetical protein